MDEEPVIVHHPLRTPWKQRFPNAELVCGFEGGSYHRADAEGFFWLISDSGTMADLLGGEDRDLIGALITLRRWTTLAAREAFIDHLADWREQQRRSLLAED